jgi:hypothetical protein
MTKDSMCQEDMDEVVGVVAEAQENAAGGWRVFYSLACW